VLISKKFLIISLLFFIFSCTVIGSYTFLELNRNYISSLISKIPFISSVESTKTTTTTTTNNSNNIPNNSVANNNTEKPSSDNTTDTPAQTPTAVIEQISVMSYGAKADGITDDTAAFQAAIDYLSGKNGGIVNVPSGSYLIDPLVSINMKSGVSLALVKDANLLAKTNSSTNYAIVSIVGVSDVSITGGQIVGERYNHTGTTGEWGMGIDIEDSTNITITDVRISDCWGDGIYIGTRGSGYSKNVTIARVNLNNNRRQGISIITVDGLSFKDSTASNTHGTMPQSGMDIEPNFPTEVLKNILIENFHTENNAGYGLECWLGDDEKRVPKSNVANIVIKNHTDTNSATGSIHNIPEYIKEGYDIIIE